jgi:hypothetical protein
MSIFGSICSLLSPKFEIGSEIRGAALHTLRVDEHHRTRAEQFLQDNAGLRADLE